MTWDGHNRRREDLTMESMRKDIQNLLISVGEIKNEMQNITRHNTDFRDSVNKNLAKLESTVYGNGKPGLTHHLARIDDLDEKIGFHIMTDRWFYGVVIMSLGWVMYQIHMLPR